MEPIRLTEARHTFSPLGTAAQLCKPNYYYYYLWCRVAQNYQRNAKCSVRFLYV